MSWLARKLGRFSISGTAKIIVWRSTGELEVPLPEGLTVRKATAADIDAARSLEDDSGIAYLKHVMANGYRAWFGYCDGIVVHRSLMLPGPCSYHLWNWTATLDVPEKEGVILGCVTHPKYGGRGIYAAVLALIARDPEWDAVWGFTEVENMASRKGLTKAGFKEHHTLAVRAWHGFAHVERGSA
jgi:RimJ/RimL family protein N-acetyltransferase